MPSQASGVSAKMIRYYEGIGLLPNVARTSSNYRVYRETDVHTLRFIRRARAVGFSMSEIQELVGLWQNRSRSAAAVKKVAGQSVGDLNAKIAELSAMGETLEDLMHNCHGNQRESRVRPCVRVSRQSLAHLARPGPCRRSRASSLASRRAASSRRIIRSRRECYPCLRYEPSPM